MAEDGRIFYVGKSKYSFPDGFYKREDYTTRCKTAYWQAILLNRHETFIKDGQLRKLQAKSLGHGVLEISIVPLGVKTNE